MGLKYKRIAKIGGQSGQGEVWRAVSASGQEVAIKYVKLPVAIAEVGTELRRFEREVACMRSLEHPHIVEILGSNLNGDKPFFVMPLASGSLRELLQLHPGGMPEDEAVELILAVMDALAYAHREGVLHRDVKPENILLYGDSPRLSDFGLGRRLQSGSATITMANVGLGTLQYSAPEQLLNGHDGDERSDVYSIGRVLYETLTGRIPFPRMDLQLVPSKFRHVVFKATLDEPSDRYRSVKAMIRDINTVVHEYESMRTPLQRAEGLMKACAKKPVSRADAAALARIILEHGDDDELMRAFVAAATPVALNAMAEASSESFEQVVRAFDRYADGQFAWAFSDRIADSLVAMFNATQSTVLRTMILKRLMELGTSHNRFYVAEKFCDLAARAFSEQVYVQIVASLLRDNPRAKDFLRSGLGRRSLPPLVQSELAA